MRSAIVDKIVSQGGDIASGFFPGSFVDIARSFQIWPESVRKVWRLVCSEGTVGARLKKTGNPARIKPEDIEFMEFLKRERPSISYSSIKDKLDTFYDIEGGTSVSAIGRTVRNCLSDGPWTWKKLSKQPMDLMRLVLMWLQAIDPTDIRLRD